MIDLSQSILTSLKSALNISNISAYDNAIIKQANMVIAFLLNNGIPLAYIDSQTKFEDWVGKGLQQSDCLIVENYLTDSLYMKLNIDRMSTTTKDVLNQSLSIMLNQLKVRYD